MRIGNRERLQVGEHRNPAAVRTTEWLKLLSAVNRKESVDSAIHPDSVSQRSDRFLLRGLAGAAAEVYLVAIAHNIMKWATARLLFANLLRRFVSRPAFSPRLASQALA
ncbi:MAG: hypothetical protein A2Z18_06565 [Armatimonadetes bacterium RBG_16_58_9]|nr:MAG: hypothetical protein A2Z18_06565 [Armatimonadetes bacterium RBG_16_58_9]